MLVTIRPATLPAAAADSLRDRVVLVTGVGGGLGSATARAVARAGATAVLLGRRVRMLESLHDEIMQAGAPQPGIYPMDLLGATPKDHDDLAATLQREFGRLDGIVHAAVHFDSLQPFEQQTPEEWATALHVNVTAPFLLTRACLPLLREGMDPAVVFVLDDPVRTGNAFWGGYGVSKHALAGFASIVHEETENTRVRTHAVLPGPMRTKLRRAAYYGENTLAHPEPDFAAGVIAGVLADGSGTRGAVIDLRP